MPTSRIPNLLHLMFFLALTLFCFLLSEAGVLALTHGTPAAITLANPSRQLAVLCAAYVFTLSASLFAFPILWLRPFLEGLRWNAAKARLPFALLGLAIGFAAQGLIVFIPHPKDLPIEQIFRNPGMIWFLVLFGVVLGPLFEEVVFRGFLLPALAIAVDYLRVPRDPDPLVSLQHLTAWRSTSTLSKPAVILSTIVTSALFALIHGPQLGYTWQALAVLGTFSVVLCMVRLRTDSVAASTLVHGSYNLTVFLSLFVASGGFRHLDRL